eukprot:g41510.t1
MLQVTLSNLLNNIKFGHTASLTYVQTLSFVPLVESKGYEFESETDTESIAKLIKYVHDNSENENISFATLVERVIQQLDGNFGGQAAESMDPVDGITKVGDVQEELEEIFQIRRSEAVYFKTQ